MIRTIETPKGIVTIRAGQEGDAPAFRAVRLEALQNHPQAFASAYEDSFQLPLSYWEERLLRLGDEAQLFFAEHCGIFTGMCGITRAGSKKTRHSAFITSVYVQPQWRGQGLAGALIETCIEWAQAQCVRWLKLAVVTTNTTATRCYERYGFSVYGVEPEVILYNGVYHDELLMVRQI
jgi:ribosomal protein S18 acetylase RimI-like enzyme